MTHQYPSKVSYGLLLFILVIAYMPLIPILSRGNFSTYNIIAIGFLTLIVAFLAHLLCATSYTIEENTLKVKVGLFSYKPIAINTIKEIKKSSSILSAPAASLDRIEITYGKYDSIILSPKDKQPFVNHLLTINPNIKNNMK